MMALGVFFWSLGLQTLRRNLTATQLRYTQETFTGQVSVFWPHLCPNKLALQLRFKLFTPYPTEAEMATVMLHIQGQSTDYQLTQPLTQAESQWLIQQITTWQTD